MTIQLTLKSSDWSVGKVRRIRGKVAERSARVSRSPKALPGIRGRWERCPGLETSGCPPQERVGAPGLGAGPLTLLPALLGRWRVSRLGWGLSVSTGRARF